ncbi:DUF1127 domain-containing protein [Paracoccus sp. DK608]|uniref:DUF1127 domain-containing protein n=2 Tax=Paracoccus shanxieyensis TaxID=2675752 RepID=A0A6L6IZE2_9RHOB|nr:DUF1127 domain-containing protein [Paracoccus shanxieyensis]MTH88148.1 DUF1127 domain-containing protein [Paracoccus shanxieyensis]
MIAAMQRAFRHYVNVHSRRDQIASLEALSDQQLAAMGLTRDRIVQHVFRDRLI